MKRLIIAMAALAMPVAAIGQTVEVAAGNWSDIPMVKKQPPLRVPDSMMAKIDMTLKQGKCPRFGNGRTVKMDVPFLIQFSASGVERIVVQRMDCPELESLIGSTLKRQAMDGLFTGTGQNSAGWYRSVFSYYSS